MKKGKKGRDWMREDRARDGGEGEAVCTSLSPGQVKSIETPLLPTLVFNLSWLKTPFSAF